jgi:hypothetical protein
VSASRAPQTAELDIELCPDNFGESSDGRYVIAFTRRRNESGIRRPLPVRQGVERVVAMRRNCRTDAGIVSRGTTSGLKVSHGALSHSELHRATPRNTLISPVSFTRTCALRCVPVSDSEFVTAPNLHEMSSGLSHFL